jgi:hypothetical protein
LDCGNESGSPLIVSAEAEMSDRQYEMILKSLFPCFAGVLLLSCASADRTAANISERMADVPHWMGGLPPGVPPRRGTPEYDEMMAKRAQEAARPKTEQPK